MSIKRSMRTERPSLTAVPPKYKLRRLNSMRSSRNGSTSADSTTTACSSMRRWRQRSWPLAPTCCAWARLGLRRAWTTWLTAPASSHRSSSCCPSRRARKFHSTSWTHTSLVRRGRATRVYRCSRRMLLCRSRCLRPRPSQSYNGIRIRINITRGRRRVMRMTSSSAKCNSNSSATCTVRETSGTGCMICSRTRSASMPADSWRRSSRAPRRRGRPRSSWTSRDSHSKCPLAARASTWSSLNACSLRRAPCSSRWRNQNYWKSCNGAVSKCLMLRTSAWGSRRTSLRRQTMASLLLIENTAIFETNICQNWRQWCICDVNEKLTHEQYKIKPN